MPAQRENLTTCTDLGLTASKASLAALHTWRVQGMPPSSSTMRSTSSGSCSSPVSGGSELGARHGLQQRPACCSGRKY